MRRGSLGALALLVAASLAQAGAASPDPAMAMLCAALSAPATLSYVGVVETDAGLRGQRSVYRVEHRAPDLTLRRYSAPARYAGDVLLRRGGFDYAVDAKRRRVVERPTDAPQDRAAYAEDAALIRANYRAVAQASGEVDGRPALLILAVNRYDGRTTVSVRIDRATDLALDRREFAPDGRLGGEMRFEQVRYAQPPASDFALPAGYAVVPSPQAEHPSPVTDALVRSAGFAAREPRTLADGFAALEGDFVSLRGARSLHLIYSDGIRTLSLFESAADATPNLAPLGARRVAVGSRDGLYAADGNTSLLAWSDGSLHYTLVGELALPELQTLARTIAP